MNTKAFQASNLSNNGSEDNALDEPHNYVAQIDGLENIAEVQRGRQANAEEHEQCPGQNATNVRDNAETRNRNQGGQILGCEHKLYRLERHNAEGIDLLGHFHSPNLGREGGAGSATYGDCRHQRAEFARETDCDQVNYVT